MNGLQKVKKIYLANKLGLLKWNLRQVHQVRFMGPLQQEL
ncbi:hypothetical protein SDC9_141854 [bioreactor metagenome]|uniref:Uncharacterized protein n=1 Tax=bioreactor metagenome TaxID=1076179 RepID=A0A645DZF1_9ZZZZ